VIGNAVDPIGLSGCWAAGKMSALPNTGKMPALPNTGKMAALQNTGKMPALPRPSVSLRAWALGLCRARVHPQCR